MVKLNSAKEQGKPGLSVGKKKYIKTVILELNFDRIIAAGGNILRYSNPSSFIKQDWLDHIVQGHGNSTTCLGSLCVWSPSSFLLPKFQISAALAEQDVCS